jgi:hypothetical protein
MTKPSKIQSKYGLAFTYMAKRIKKQIYSFHNLGVELFNIFEYIQTYSQFPKSSLYFILTFDYSIQT